MECKVVARDSGVTADGVPWDSITLAPKTEEEIKISKILDRMDLERLEQDREVYDMEGYQDRPVKTFSPKDSQRE